MAGLVNPPNMGVYNVSKHAVVSLSETLYQDLRPVTDQIGASVLCPFFVSTGITPQRAQPSGRSGRQRATKSQRLGQAMTDRAGGQRQGHRGHVAQQVFDALREQRRTSTTTTGWAQCSRAWVDPLQLRNPSDPFAAKAGSVPSCAPHLRAAD